MNANGPWRASSAIPEAFRVFLNRRRKGDTTITIKKIKFRYLKKIENPPKENSEKFPTPGSLKR
jgi:hypothetical protein